MASDRDLKLRLVMALADKVTKPLKRISEGSGTVSYTHLRAHET